jgi:hydroxymethylbilane synthase
MGKTLLRLGTLGSPLALAQATELRARLGAAHPELTEENAIETVVIRTTGDTIGDRTLAAIGGKGLFTKEIEEALLAGSIDMAVHSMKDMPTVLPDGLVIACHLPREDSRDAFICLKAASLTDLPHGACVGTASLRRQAQLLHLRPDLRVVALRGNVETRLRKLGDGAVDATLLALAGLKRLGLADHATAVLTTAEMLPAVAQGAICIETRAGDERVHRYLLPLDDHATARCVAAERAFLAVLDGTCRTPIAGLATLSGDDLVFDGMIVRPDGSERHVTRRYGAAGDAAALGADAGRELRALAGPGFFDLPLPEARTL